MKFILTENKKFVLEERFTLQEASVAEVTRKWAAQLSDTFNNTEEALKKYQEFAGNREVSSSKVKALKTQFETTSVDLQTSLELPATEIAEDLVKIKVELNKYVQVLKQVTEKIKSSTSNEDTLTLLATRIKKLESIYNKATWGAADITQLQSILTWAGEQLKPVFEEAGGHSDADIEKVKTNCTDCLNLIHQVKENLPTDFSTTTAEEFNSFKDSVQKVLEVVKNMPKAEKITRVWVIQNLKAIQAQAQALKDTYTLLSKTSIIVQQLNNRAKATASAERDFAGAGDQDWKTKYAAAIDKDTVIEEFIYTIWEDVQDANRVLQIKKAIAQECEEFGFKPSNADGKNGNPFIEFISNVYLKYNIKPEAYNVIHNLVANGKLKAADLVGAESSVLGKGNLIFCKDLYNQEAPVIKLYLNKQNNLLKATSKPDTFSSIPEMVFNMLYKLPEIVTGPRIKNGGSMNLKINTLPAIEELEAKWTGSVSETKLDPNDKPEKTKVVNADLINKLTTPADAAKLLVALATKFSSDANILAVVESCAEAKQLLTQSTTLADVQKLVASVERAYDIKNISASQALSLAKSILDAADKLGLTRA